MARTKWIVTSRRFGRNGESEYGKDPIVPRLNAENRGRVTCLFRTQFPPQSGRFFPVFSTFEARDLSAIQASYS
jgi:hypothetical protein